MNTIKKSMHILDEAQSICPVCHRPVKAYYAVEKADFYSDGCCEASAEDAAGSCCGAEESPVEVCCCGTEEPAAAEVCCCGAPEEPENLCCTNQPENESVCCCSETDADDSGVTGESQEAGSSCCCGETQELPEDACCCAAASENGYSGRVYFVKECPEHGMFRTTVAENAADYIEWVRNPVVNIPPERPLTKGDPADSECPLHCGTCENHLQTACCVLIDLTDRCNQHCPYCFAKAEEDADRSSEPTLEEIEAKYDLLLELGEERPFNIQLSGGEPTVRDDLPEIIKMARDKGFEYVQINTNGRKLALVDGYAKTLKDAGATVIFMQFDGTRDDIYMKLRGEPLFEIKKKAIRNCEKAGLAVTLVPTMVEGVNMDNIGEMMDFLIENVNVVKGIHFQPVSFFGRHPEKVSDGCSTEIHSGDFPGRVTMFGLLHELERQKPEFRYGDFCPIATGHTLCCFYSTYTKERDGSIRCALTADQKSSGVSCCDAGGSYDVGESCCCGDDTAHTVKGSGISCCDMTTADKLEVIKKDRDYVLNKWEIAAPEDEESCCCSQTETEGSCCAGSSPEKECCSEAPGSTACCCESEQTEESCCCTEEIQEPACCSETSGNSVCCCGAEEPADADVCCCGTQEDEIMDIDEFLRYYRRNTFTVTGMAFQDTTNLDAERVKRCRVQVLSPDNRLIPFCAYNSIYRQ